MGRVMSNTTSHADNNDLIKPAAARHSKGKAVYGDAIFSHSFWDYRILLPSLVRAQETPASQMSSARMHVHGVTQRPPGLCLLTAPEIGFDGLPDKLFPFASSSSTLHQPSPWFSSLSGSDSGAQCGLGSWPLAPEPKGHAVSFPLSPTSPGVRMRTCVCVCVCVRPVVAVRDRPNPISGGSVVSTRPNRTTRPVGWMHDLNR